MSLFDWLFGDGTMDSGPSVNPATGLPMISDFSDVAGNPYGADLHLNDHCHDSMDWSGVDSACSTDFGSSMDFGCSMDSGYSIDVGCSNSPWD